MNALRYNNDVLRGHSNVENGHTQYRVMTDPYISIDMQVLYEHGSVHGPHRRYTLTIH